MKHQYFGDINDYCKYGILRALSIRRLKTTVCWMLTENDSRNDGRHINYLQKKEKYQQHDQELFGALYDIVFKKKQRNINWIQKSQLIANAKYHSQVLNDNLISRRQYYEKLTTLAHDSDLIFFDPDNGIEVKLKPKGKKDSKKYLYWDEVERFWKLGYSLLIYQHFPRVNRWYYIRKLSKKIRSRTGATEVVVLKTSTVAFFLLPQRKHRKSIDRAIESIRTKWIRMIEVVE